jgi:hypothetical protein
MCGFGRGSRIPVARLAQVFQRQRGAPFNDAHAVLNPLHVNPNIKRRKKVVIEYRVGVKMTKPVEVQQECLL